MSPSVATQPSVAAPLLRGAAKPARDTLPEAGLAAEQAADLLRQHLAEDGPARRNLATFVTTRMGASAERLAQESLDRNLINAAEYPATDRLHQLVVRTMAGLFHGQLPAEGDAGFIGTTTVGSSEALMLALLTHKWNWQQRQARRPGATAKDKPLLVIGTHTHACFAKFARYFDVQVKWLPLAPGQFAITAQQVRDALACRLVDDPDVMGTCGLSIDEAGDRVLADLVIAVGCVLGSTYTGAIDDVAGIDQVLRAGGWDIPIHVDAASGGFVLPFTQPERAWDFRLPQVQSINVSNHKYGGVYAGLGTLVFRHDRVVPEDLLVDVHYLSGEMRNFSLNFSRPSQGVVLQAFNFLHLGRQGYRAQMVQCLAMAQWLAAALEDMGCFEVVSDPTQLPIVAFKWRDARRRQPLQPLADQLARQAWRVPVYRLPAHHEAVEVMRVVVRPDFTARHAAAFLGDLMRAAADQRAAGRDAAAPPPASPPRHLRVVGPQEALS